MRFNNVMAGRKARSAVFAPEGPAIHVLLAAKVNKTWMPGIKPGMTKRNVDRRLTGFAPTKKAPSREPF